MTEADKNFYFNSERVNVKQTRLKLINKLAKATKYNHVPLVVTPYMSERFNAQLNPFQFQVAQPHQQQQQQQEEQQLQLQLQQPPENQPQPLQIQQSPHQSPQPSPQQSPQHSPIQQQPSHSFEDEPLHYDFFEPQPSSSEPILPLTQTQYSPQTQSTSQPLPSDSAINPGLQAFQDDLQVARVLSDFSSNFNVDNSEYGCNFDLFCQPSSNEPDNTQVHNPADDFVQQTISSPNRTNITTMQPVRKVARKRRGSSFVSEPVALSSQKKQRVEASETTTATSLPSQKGLDFEMENIQSLESFSQQNESIKIDRPATVPCKESSTALALTRVQNQANTQELLGNVQVDLPSMVSGGQFVPPLPLNPFQGTLVVYTGTARSVNEMRDVRQTPIDTHAREESETALSVREVSAYTDQALFEERMSKLQAELARMIAENERLKGAQLVTLEKKVEGEPSSSYRDELKDEIHDFSSSKSTAQETGEDPSTKGENRDKGGEDKGNSSNQSNKGNTNTNTSDSAPGRDTEKSKGTQPMQQQEDNYDAYPKEMDDDDVFDATYCQNHEDGVFDEAYLFHTEEEAIDLEHE
ncbi:uncharacterized protein LOC135151356 [Daucus carota subsp. sativus]|uniref:uncharacterized protein LOC135151356 n=1 Tax=Daucus carota subsp. sativus TaxID=79200 RepID=UPI0030827F1F